MRMSDDLTSIEVILAQISEMKYSGALGALTREIPALVNPLITALRAEREDNAKLSAENAELRYRLQAWDDTHAEAMEKLGEQLAAKDAEIARLQKFIRELPERFSERYYSSSSYHYAASEVHSWLTGQSEVGGVSEEVR